MGTFYINDPQTGFSQPVRIDGDKPSLTEQARIDQWLAGRNPIPKPRVAPTPVEEDDGTALGRGWQSGIAMLQELGGSALEGGAGAAGLEGLARYGTGVREGGDAAQQGIQRLRRQDVDTIGEGLTYVGELAGEQAPILGTTLAGTLAGSAAGSVFGPVGSVVGGVLGGAAASLPILFGGNREEQRDVTGEIDERTAFLASLPQAALEGLAGKFMIRGFSPTPGSGILTRVTKRGAEGVATEVPTEIGQEVIQIAQAGGDITSDEAIERYIDAGIAAGILGGGIGATAGGLNRQKEPGRQLEEDLQREALETQSRTENATRAAEQQARREAGDANIRFQRTEADDAPDPEFRSTQPVEGFTSERGVARGFQTTRNPEFKSARGADIPENTRGFQTVRGQGEFSSVRNQTPTFQSTRKEPEFRSYRDRNPYFQVTEPEFQSARTIGKFESERGKSPIFRTSRQSALVGQRPVRQFRDQVDRPQLATSTREQLNKLGLNDFALKIVGTIDNDPTIAGKQDFDNGRGFIALATDIYDPDEKVIAQRAGDILNHEAIHALRGLDLFKSGEFSDLTKATKAQKRMVDGKKRDYSYYDYEKAKADRLGYGQDKERIAEEAIAEMYRDHAGGRLKLGGKPRSLWQRFINAIKAIGTAGRSMKLNRAGDIFGQIDRGEIGARPRAQRTAGSAARYSRALDMFHSPLLRGVGEAKQKKAMPKDWKAIISKLPGVKKAEVDWLGVEDWLDAQGGRQVTRDELRDFITDHQITIHEDVGGGEGPEISIGEVQNTDPPDDWISDETEYQEGFYREEYPEWSDERVEEVAREAAYTSWYEQEDPPGYVDVMINGYHEAEVPYEGGQYTLPDGTVTRDADEVEAWFRSRASAGDYDFPARHIDYTEPDGEENYREILLRVPSLHETGRNAPPPVIPDEELLDPQELTRWREINQQIEDLIARVGPYAEVKDEVEALSAEREAMRDEIYRRRPDVADPSPRPKPFVNSHHFDQPNVVVHARVNDRNGGKTLFVEEVQSDLTSMHREMRTSEQQAAFEKAQKAKGRRDDLAEGLARFIGLELGINDAVAFSILSRSAAGLTSFSDENQRYNRRIMEYLGATPTAMENFNRLREYSQEYYDSIQLAGGHDLAPYRPDIPDTPFKEELPYSLMMKRLLREAADKGYERLAWTPSEIQTNRWGEAYEQGYKTVYDRHIKKAVEKATKKYGGKVGVSTDIVPGRGLRNDLDRNRWLAKNNITIADVIQRMKEKYSSAMLVKMDEKGGPERVLLNAAEELTGGGIQNKEDMVREFMSRSEANFDRLFPEAHSQPVWYIDITPEIREGVKETMAMFSRSLPAEPSVSSRYSRNQQAPLSLNELEQMDHHVIYGKTRQAINKVLGKVLAPDQVDDASYYFFSRFQDANIAVGDLMDELRQKGFTLSDALDSYRAEEISHGIIGEETRLSEEKLYEPAVEELSNLDIDPEDIEALRRTNGYFSWREGIDKKSDRWYRRALGKRPHVSLQVGDAYIYALHAKEYNQRMRDNGSDKDNPSGMSDAEADAILKWVDGLDTINKSSLERFAQRVRDIVEDTNRRRVEGGLIPRAWVDIYQEDGRTRYIDKQYGQYVPVRGIRNEDDGLLIDDTKLRATRIGGVRGKEDPERKGRTTYAGISPLEMSMMQNANTIQRVARNDIIRAMVNLADAMPDALRSIDKTMHRIPRGQVNTNDIRHVGFKEDGIQKYLYVGDGRIARAMERALNPVTLNSVGQAMSKWNRFLANVNTQYNPEFVFSNLIRDIQFSMVNAQQHEVEGIHKNILRNQGAAYKTLQRFVRADKRSVDGRKIRSADIGDPKYDVPLHEASDEERLAQLREYLVAGSKNGINQMGDLQSIEDMARSVIHEIGERGKSGKDTYSLFLGKGKSLLKVLEDYNEIAENMSRFSFYSEMRRNGRTQAQAAQAARNLTTNFSKGGEWKSFMNAMYLFYNASLQGSMALINAGARSPKVRKALVGTVVAGAMSDIILSALSPEDDDGTPLYDKIPQYVLEHNLVLPNPLGGYFTVPLPYGLNTFFNTGRATSRMARGGYRADQYRDSVIGTALEMLNPLGDNQSMLSALMPTIADPFVDLKANENYRGDPIYPEAFPGDPGTAVSYQHWNSTSPTLVKSAKWLNDFTGGTPIEPGLIDWQPDKMEYWIDYITGGAGKFALRLGEAPMTTLLPMLKGDFEEGFLRETPFVRRFQYTPADREDISAFYDKFDQVKLARKEFMDAVEVGDRKRIERAKKKYSGELRIYGAVNGIYNARRKLIDQKNVVMESEQLSDKRKEQILERIDEREQALIDRGNELMRNIR